MRVRTGTAARGGGALLVVAVVLICASPAAPADDPPAPPAGGAQASLLSLPTPIGAVRYTPGHGLRVGDTGLTLAGYGAIDLLHEEGGATTFRVENADLFVIWDPLARVHLFSEIDMVDQENPHEQRRTILTDRLFGDFAGFDWLNLRVGKFLTPIGRWNQIHARPLVWTTSRPLATTLPFDPYVTGAMLFGSRFPRAGTLTYSLYGQFTNSFDVEPPAQPMDRGVGGRVEYASFGGWSVAGSYLDFTALPGGREAGGTAAGNERGRRRPSRTSEPWRSSCIPTATWISTCRTSRTSICAGGGSGRTGHRSWRSIASRKPRRARRSRGACSAPIRRSSRDTGTRGISRASFRRRCCRPAPP